MGTELCYSTQIILVREYDIGLNGPRWVNIRRSLLFPDCWNCKSIRDCISGPVLFGLICNNNICPGQAHHLTAQHTRGSGNITIMFKLHNWLTDKVQPSSSESDLANIHSAEPCFDRFAHPHNLDPTKSSWSSQSIWSCRAVHWSRVDVGRSCHFKGQIFQIAHLTQSS